MGEERQSLLSAVIKVVGVGGGGGNALNTMIGGGLEGVDFIAANTDVQALERNLATTRIRLGTSLTRGLGAGANPEVGRQAAMESSEEILEHLRGADMVFVTAGMGGGTGTGGAPVVAELARQCGALTVGVVTRPFPFEGKKRGRQAEEGIAQLRAAVDALIIIPNARLIDLAPPNMPIGESFRMADEVLLHAVQGISDVIMKDGMINVDFADVRTIMREQGLALMGSGVAEGPNRAETAARAAVHSPLLEDVNIDGAMGILINITGGRQMTLSEVTAATSYVQGLAHDDANIIFGSVLDDTMGDKLKVTVIATGFDRARAARHTREPLQEALIPSGISRPSRPSLARTEGRVTPIPPPRPEAYDAEPIIDLSRPTRRVELDTVRRYADKITDLTGRPNAPMKPAAELDELEYDRPAFQRKNELSGLE